MTALPDITTCCQCGGHLTRVARPGRLVPWRNGHYLVPEDMALLTCQDCGAEWTDGAEERRIEEACRAQRDAKNETSPTSR